MKWANASVRGLAASVCAPPLLVLAFALFAGVAMAVGDKIDLPPERREFSSPSGVYSLTATTADGWKTPRAALELYGRRADGRALPLWKHVFPHHHGPRRALVSDRGEVLLVDEWINVLSKYALTLVGPDGRTIAEYTAQAVVERLGVGWAQISLHAKLGPWLSEEPTESPDGRFALISAGGRLLTVEFAGGRLEVR